MKRYFKFLSVFIVLSIIPLLFIGGTNIIINDVNSDAKKIVYSMLEQDESIPREQIKQLSSRANIHIVCNALQNDQDISKDIESACKQSTQLVSDLTEYNSYAWIVILIGLISVLIVAGLSIISNINRFFLLVSFKLGLFITSISSAIMLLSQSALLCGLIYYLTSYFTSYILPKLLFVIALVGVWVSAALIWNMIKKISKKQVIVGYSVSKTEQKKLWDFITDIAIKFNTQIPDNIVLGLGDNYYVLQSDVVCLSGHLTGRTLFISLSCLSKFTKDELTAIIVHELSHFKGKDTFYTLHFYPSWKRVESSVADINNISSDNIGSLVAMPIQSLFYNFMNMFKLTESKLSRSREKLADTNAAKFTSNKSIASALLKLTYFSNFWQLVEKESLNALKDDKYIINKNNLFNQFISDIKVDENKIHEFVNISALSHPFDTHPSLSERLNYLNVDFNDILKDLYLSNKNNASTLIINISKIEEDLSVAESQLGK